jgi:N-acetyl-anhydromuramyl-L-alanine amidase AmpD
MSFEPDHAQARPCPSPNHGERARPISALVLHYTGTPTAEDALALLCDPASQVSAHYFIHEDGEILQLLPETRRAWHAGKSYWGGERDMNSASIGVEIVHPGHDEPRPFPARQIEAVASLARDICARRSIAPQRVLAHSDIAVARKIDPGEFFPWDELARQGVGHFVEPAPLAAGQVLDIGASGEEVADLQRALADYGYEIAKTGVYDLDTAKTVAAFQRHFRPQLVDGRADVSTLRTLNSLANALKERA